MTRPGMTIVCGDSHTSTHGAFGALAFGIGSSQIRDVLATQCVAMDQLKVRKIEVNGRMKPGVTAKDVALFIINRLGAGGGIGYVYEFCGEVLDSMGMEERMTVCNMSIEGGARAGYVNPDQVTFDYLYGREHSPKGEAWDRAVTAWKNLGSDRNAVYDDAIVFDAAEIEPRVTWGVTPAQSVAVGESLPDPGAAKNGSEREAGPAHTNI